MVRAAGQQFNAAVVEAFENMTPVLWDESTLRGFMVPGQTDSVIGCIFHRRQRGGALDLRK